MPSSEKLGKLNAFNNSDLGGDFRTPYKYKTSIKRAQGDQQKDS